MSTKTGIQWTDHTHNIVWGCIEVSEGCENCYARTFATRLGFDIWGPAKTTDRRVLSNGYWREPLAWEREAAADPAGGVCRDIPGRLVFCSSMADVFEDHPVVDTERERLWPLIRATPHLTWQLLTKRPERIAANLPSDWGDGYPNVWLGTSIESQRWMTRFEELIAVPANARFVSAEPLLGPLDFGTVSTPAELRNELQWLIVGGESGPKARPFHIPWARSLVAQSRAAGIAPFVKQLGARPYCDDSMISYKGNTARLPADGYRWLNDSHGGDITEWPEDLRVREFPTHQEPACNET